MRIRNKFMNNCRLPFLFHRRLFHLGSQLRTQIFFNQKMHAVNHRRHRYRHYELVNIIAHAKICRNQTNAPLKHHKRMSNKDSSHER